MVQDTNTSQNSLPLTSADPQGNQPVGAVPPMVNATPSATDPSVVTPTVVEPHEVQVDGDVQAVPQEGVGLQAQTSVVPNGTPQPTLDPIVPAVPQGVPPVQPVQEADTPLPEVSQADTPVVEMPGSTLPVVDDVPVTDEETPSDAVPEESLGASSNISETPEESADGEKSPLDILEEILAGAEAEKKQVDEEQKQKDQEEAEFQAQLKVKEEKYQVEAQQRLEVSHDVVEEAKQQRADVDKQLLEQGKIEEQSTGQSDEFAIHQLEHQKPE